MKGFGLSLEIGGVVVENSEFELLSDRELCGLVADMAQRIESHVRKAADVLGITTSQAVALRELTGPLTLSELAKCMCCEASNATFVADKLEGSGYIQRIPHEHDRRSKQLLLTPAGVAKRNELMSLLVEKSPLGGLSNAEQLALRALLKRAIAGGGSTPSEDVETG